MRSLCLGLLAAVLPVTSALAQDAKPAGGFTDITVESGIAQVLADHYKYMGSVLSAAKSEESSWWISGPTLVDMTGSGRLDLHIAGHGQSAIALWNDGHGKFTAIDPKRDLPRGKNKKNDNPLPGGEIRMAYDLNEDGKPDLLVSYGDGQGVIYLNDCKAGSPPTWNFKVVETGFDAFSRGTALADVNHDGLVDYLWTADEGRKNPMHPCRIALGKGDMKWEVAPSVTVPKEAGTSPATSTATGLSISWGASGYNDSVRMILLNDGKGSFTNATKNCGLEEAGSISGVGDVNQDGTVDLICLDMEGKAYNFAIYLNDGKGHFTKSPNGIENFKGEKPSTGNWGGAIVSDFDNDGIADIVMHGRDFMWALHGLGGGKFEYVTDKWNFPRGFHPDVDEANCFGDITGDGMLDFITYLAPKGGHRHELIVLRNDLPKRNWVRVQLVGAKGNRAAANSTIRITEPGTGKLLWSEQVLFWGRQQFHNYYTAANTERHFGLGDKATVDVSVEFYPSGKKVEKKGVAANKIVTVTEESGAVEAKGLE